ncbi:TetR/AcrR family transcriptional regulator [Modestobacter sp. L9-4]|uniref:TetR/AcrR family transcriptional regulator n=1 Tax=Modestobacter sp. L9-4 TaxID=2851567 RepID=UPI001F46720C|nr:TetR/AcrR family transcriptional regulator [Modestobacter sp. L9-4]
MSPRAYSSPLRAESAARTRQVVLDAARSCFLEHGYARTSVAQIAAAAGVAVATVYTAVGGKPQLVDALTRTGMDAESIEAFSAELAGLDDGRAVLQLTARATGTVYEELRGTITLLVDNRLADPAVARAHDTAVAVYRERLAVVAERLRACGALRPDVPVARAADVLWFHFGLGAWLTARDLGWDLDATADWLTDQAGHALLREADGARRTG